MKEKLKSVLAVMDSIEVHGRENLRLMLACMNTLKEIAEATEPKGGVKDGDKEN